MKKIYLALAAAAMMAFTACSNENKSNEAGNEGYEAPSIKNNREGKEFIENLAKIDTTIKVTESGLAYKVVREGNGERPAPTANVKVNYSGKHINGKVFDASENHGGPAQFPLNGVVPGFSEGLQLMNKGAKYTLYIPGPLGYGAQGQPQAGIEPNELLIFDIELIDYNNDGSPIE